MVSTLKDIQTWINQKNIGIFRVILYDKNCKDFLSNAEVRLDEQSRGK
jgi:hypothetical protein